jgi:hypothetical protein
MGFALVIIAAGIAKVIKDVTDLPNPVTAENKGAIL